MKLTKELETEILNIYNDYWDAYLKGDMPHFANMLDEDLSVFGTAISEVFNNKEEAVAFYNATAEQMVGKADCRNRQYTVQLVGDSIFIREQNDLFVLIENEWNFYAHARITAIFRQRKGDWKLVHQHASFPDTKAGEGEQIAAEKMRAENLELREAVKRRTVELEYKNRDLEIEASLERVRTVAMGMKRPDDLLQICTALFKELGLLGFDELRMALIHTYIGDENYFIDYDYCDLTGGAINHTPYSGNPVIERFIKEIRIARDAFSEIVVTGKELQDWKEFRIANGQADDPRLNNISALYYYNYSVGPASIGISTFSSISKKKLELLKRFRNVFDFAYQRYSDVAKAEAQAREARIEASLERVRSRSMAMHKTDELLEAAELVYRELSALGINSMNVSYAFVDEKEQYASYYSLNPVDNKIPPFPFVFPHGETEVMRSILSSWKKQEPFHVTELDEEGTLQHQTWVGEHIQQLITRKNIDMLFSVEAFLEVSPKKAVLSTFNFKNGYLFHIGGQRLTNKEEELLLRFTKVFEQTYTRFLDLQKAEAQTREAQIEAALERTRTHSMLMQHSNELDITARVFHEQLLLLGIDSELSYVWLPDVEKNKHLFWATWNEEENGSTILQSKSATYDLDRTEPYTAECFTAWESGEPVHVYPVAPDQVKHYFDTWSGIMGDAKKLKPEFFTEGLAYVESFMKYGCFGIIVRRLLSDDERKILFRFTVEFERTYTRFLDLQKAEEQTRESQIELGLERVRARTMAMQHSSELQDAAIVLFDQMKALGIHTGSCGFNILNKKEACATVWMSSPEGGIQTPFTLPLTKSAVYKEVYEAMKKGEDLLVKEVSGKDLIKHFDYLLTLHGIGDVIKRLRETGYLFPETIVFHFAFFTQGYLSFHLHEPHPQAHDIFIRFAKVFEQTYTRFLDLQKAEAQSREAQIELALERLRARTMAMQKSDELTETSLVLFQQLKELGEPAEQFTIGIIKEGEGVVEISATLHGSKFQQAMKVNIDEPFVMNKVVAGWKTQQKELVLEVKGKELEDYNRYRNKLVGAEMFSTSLHPDERWIVNAVYFSRGMLALATNEPRPKESLQLLGRFASVFDQTYTRFLDLQRAEGQAREAQIEAALERVRSRTMGMQKSEELKEVIQVVYDQFVQLNIGVEHTGFIMDYKERDDMLIWLADKHEVPFQVTIPYFDCAHWNSYNKAKENGTDFFANHLGFEEKNKFYLDLFKLVPGVTDAAREYYFSSPGLAISTVLLENVGLYIENFSGIPYTDEENSTLMRFGKVFQQTYTRFLDLQKAEAQAKEAQIETALEKIRSHTMGMRSSEDLSNVAAVMFDQMRILGGDLFSFGIVLCDKHEKMVEQWHSIPGAGMMAPFFVPVDLDHIHRYRYDQWRAGVELFSVIIPEDYIARHFELMLDLPSVKAEWEGIAAKGISLPAIPTWEIDYGASFKYGYLLVSALKPFEDDKIFPRFAKVFEQAYTRFLDLQKAEAQTRESQIELGLERVRARAMAMQKSDELKELIGTVFTELTKLDLVLTRCLIMIYDPNTKGSTWWMANSEAPSDPSGLMIKYHKHPPYTSYLAAWQERKNKWQYILEGKDKKDWDDFLFKETELSNLPDFVIEGMKEPDKVYLNASFNSFGNLTLATLEPLSNEHFNIMLRFAKVFDLTYTRFNDLQKAEAQARESQIEASLERIRAKAMAMHLSEEIDEVLEVLFDQFDVLGIMPVSTHLTLIDIETNSFTFRETGKGGRKSFGEQRVPFDSMEIWKEVADRWKASDPLSLNKLHFPKESLPLVWQVYHESFASMPEGHKITPEDYPDGIYHTAGNCKFGYIGMNHIRPATEEEEQIVLKFAVEFGRLYQRYLDLQKAEAQTKEAKIETAIERVRSASLAMHKSEELKYVIKVVFDNLDPLGLKNIDAVIINILHQGSKDFDLWLAVPGQDYSWNFPLAYFDHPIANDFFKAVEQGLTLHRKIYSFELKNSYFRYMFEHADKKYLPAERKEFILKGPGYAVSAAIARYSSILIQNYRGIPFSDEENSILMRFSKVLDQTYTRFLDLQKAEAQGREVRIEGSLERVRSKAMAMHSSQDLANTIVAFYHELESFSITPRRCGVGLINKESRIAELSTMNTTGDGKSIEVIGAVKLTGHPVLEGIYDNWLLQKEYHPVLRGPEISAYYQLLRPQIVFPDYPDDAVQFGYFFYFPEGGVYAWTDKEMVEDELVIYRRFTSVLSLTYKRYKDLQQAEDLAKQAADDLVNLKLEKKRTEDALTELKNTQSQLVQAEKMASLGELTAGIAHEIQNPLNFVNNFSDVSTELLDEMQEQLATGNIQQATELADDIKQNLEKILHHGKRADGIVKGMLQHSRSSSGQQEATDLNALADEYTRLAFHGLRAKDKSFNVAYKTDFDNSLVKIEIVPQDIGRVLINLLNNAFYAVNEKRKRQVKGYEPVVVVSTKKIGDRIELRVTDNGNGIPDEAVEKIFQPFFTTKPTGQGTGLGLSLSYDIVKAHGGELKVHTELGKGSEFIIALPA